MKTLFNVFLVLCISLPLLAQDGQRRSVSSFTKLSIAVPADVHLSKGPFKVVLEGEDLHEVETFVKGNELVIKRKTEKWSWFGNSNRNKIIIYISMPALEAASMSGSGKLESNDEFTAKHMKLRVSGSGAMHIPVAAERVDAHVSGSGDMQLSITAQRVETHISGSGSIEAEGSANMLEAHISGSGKVRAENLRTQSVEAHISGSGSCYVHADEKIDAKISGSGNVQYTGNATNINSRTSGSGKITKRG